MTTKEYIDTSVVDLELHFRSVISQLRDPKDVCHVLSYMSRLNSDDPELREMFRERISKLMK